MPGLPALFEWWRIRGGADCAERLSDYKVPETMALTREPLPRNANGKVLKRQLREALVAS